MSKMKVYTIKFSSNIKRISYCMDCKSLFVKFVHGGVYKYLNVDEYDYNQFIVNDGYQSVGGYFNDNIKDNHMCKIIIPSNDLAKTNRFNMEKACTCKIDKFNDTREERKYPETNNKLEKTICSNNICDYCAETTCNAKGLLMPIFSLCTYPCFRGQKVYYEVIEV